MKKRLLSLTLLLSLGLSFSGVAAQVGTQEAEVGMPADIEGLISAYDRTYTVDFEKMVASPSAEMDTSAMMRMVSVQGMTFDTGDNAEKYLDEMTAQIEEAMNDESVELGDVEISDDLGDLDKDGLLITTSMEDYDSAIAVLVFVDGDQLFQVTAMDSDLDTATTAVNDVAKSIVDAETETDDVTFNEDGTSTGGVYDRMPVAGDDTVADLPMVTDMALLEEGGE